MLQIFLVFIFFNIYVFNVNVNISGDKFPLFWVACFLLLFYSLISGHLGKFFRLNNTLAAFFTASAIFAALLILIYPSNFLVLAEQYFIGLLLILTSSTLGAILARSRAFGDTNLIYNIVLFAILLNSVVLISSVWEPVSSLLYEVIWVPQVSMEAIFHANPLERRYQGVSSYGFSVLSLTYAMLILGLLIFFKRGRDGGLFFYISCFSGFCAILLSGRTGLLVLLLGSAYVFFKKFSIILYIKILFLILFFLFLLVIMDNWEIVQLIMRFSFEPFHRFLDEGEFVVRSIDILLDGHIFFPSNVLGIILGTGNFSLHGDELERTDIGFLKLFNGGGLIAILMWLSVFVPILLKSLRFDKNRREVVLLFFLAILIGNFKDYYFLYANGVTQIFFIVYFYCLYSNCRAPRVGLVRLGQDASVR